MRYFMKEEFTLATQNHKPIQIDFSGIEIEEIKLFVQEGVRGTPEMAASCRLSVASCSCHSCTQSSCIRTDFEGA
jgi:hypothetical protein